MRAETANVAMQFLNRITLQPGEIPAFTQVMKELEIAAQPAAPTLVEDEPAQPAA
jgi:hypothetical protein